MPSAAKQMSPFHYWISFWPQAPLFGVEWRYARYYPALAWFNPADTLGKMARASVTEAMKASEEAAEAAVHAAEEATARIIEIAAPFEAAETAPESIAEAAPEAVLVPPPVLYDIAPETVDDLKQIKGIGPKLEDMLNAMGIYRLRQIADFTPENLAWVDNNLTAFKGRPLRDDWVTQARALL